MRKLGLLLVCALFALLANAQLGDKYTVKIVDDHLIKLTCGTTVIEMSLENSGVFSNGDVIFVKLPVKGSVLTDKVFKDNKGNVYPVYKSSTGRYYYIKTSAKTGNEYKVYVLYAE